LEQVQGPSPTELHLHLEEVEQQVQEVEQQQASVPDNREKTKIEITTIKYQC
jgi:ArsR family metal-binding transcriptional regulator